MTFHYDLCTISDEKCAQLVCLKFLDRKELREMNSLDLANANHLRDVAVVGALSTTGIVTSSDNGKQLPALHLFASENSLRDWEPLQREGGRRIRLYCCPDTSLSSHSAKLSELFLREFKPAFDLVILAQPVAESADVPFVLLLDQLLQPGGYLAFDRANLNQSPSVSSTADLLLTNLNYLQIRSGSLYRKRIHPLREATKESLLVSPPVAREVELCPYRKPARILDHEERAICTRIVELSNVADHSLAEVPRHICDSCRSKEPNSFELNPMVASELYKLALRIQESGGVQGCSIEEANQLLNHAENHLEWVAGGEDTLKTATFRRKPETCLHLGQYSTTAMGDSSPRLQAIYECNHPDHETTTLAECRYCHDFDDGQTTSRVPLTELIPVTVRFPPKISSWAVGVTTAPRNKSTLDACLDSVMRAGWSQPMLFVDRGTSLAAHHLHLPVTFREHRVGAWSNFYLTLAELVMGQPDADAYLVIQDDAILYDHGNLREWLESALWPGHNIAAVSLYCSAAYTQPEPGWHRHRDLWVWGAPAFIFSNESARQFLVDASVVDHRRASRLGHANIDVVIGRWAKRRGMEIYYPTPSLVQHIGETSTLWPSGTVEGKRRADWFAGDVSRPPVRSLNDDHKRIILSHMDVDFPILYDRVRSKPFHTNPVVFHFPSVYKRFNPENVLCWFDLLRIARQKLLLKQPKNVTLVTWNNRTTRSVAEIYAEHCGLELNVLGKGISSWQNLMKIRLTQDFLKSVKTEYMLAIDGSDTVILGDVNRCVEALETAGCDALFSSETACYPNAAKLRNKQDQLAPTESPFKYLNSGVAIFRSEAAIDLFRQASETAPQRSTHSDQSVWQQLLCKGAPICLDYYCHIFQTVNRHDRAKELLEFYDGSSN